MADDEVRVSTMSQRQDGASVPGRWAPQDTTAEILVRRLSGISSPTSLANRPGSKSGERSSNNWSPLVLYSKPFVAPYTLVRFSVCPSGWVVGFNGFQISIYRGFFCGGATVGAFAIQRFFSALVNATPCWWICQVVVECGSSIHLLQDYYDLSSSTAVIPARSRAVYSAAWSIDRCV
jgi:hypothetical protein